MKNSKDIEKHLIDLMLGKSVIIDEYADVAKRIHSSLIESGINNFSEPHKPLGKGKNTYSTSTEPKTDVVFTHQEKRYRCSIKKDESAYLVSCNSKQDFITQFITIHDGRNRLEKSMIEDLEKAADYIKKVPNYNSYHKGYQKDNRLEDFIADKFIPDATKLVGAEQAQIMAEHISSKYSNPVHQSAYPEYLHEAESFIQATLKKLLVEYPEYSKEVIFELVTGKIKFPNSDCSCTHLLSSEGVFELTDPNCEYINRVYNKFVQANKIGRLQNVPRKVINKKVMKTKDLDIIADNFAIADLTFKI